MNEFEDALKQLENQSELMAEVKNAYKQGKSAEELAALLASKGVEIAPAQVEAALASMQKVQIDEIASENLDIDELNRMAGGGTGLSCEFQDDCDNSYKYIPKSGDRCANTNICDEYFWSIVM